MVNRVSRAGVMGWLLLAVGLAVAAACGSRAEEVSEGEPAPMAAATIVANALREAEADGMAVVVEFGASWCVWCGHFQRFVESEGAGAVFRDNYVVVNLNVREEEEDRYLEHPGGAEMMDQWGGASAGLPFYVFLDASGNKLADSNAMPDDSNIGFPVSETEIARFMDLIDRTAPRLEEPGRTAILEYLERSAAAL